MRNSEIVKNQLFNLQLFNPDFTVFPQQVFKEKFDEYWFMNLEDWFNNEDDFHCLCMFLQTINEPILSCAVPAFHNIPAIKIDTTKGYRHFIDEYTFTHKTNSPDNQIGLRISPTGFWYGESLAWAIVSDLTNNMYIVGLKHDAALNFKTAFAGKYFDIHQVIKNMEDTNFILGKAANSAFEYAEMDNKKEIIKRYT
jgi:hypothetical protein